MNSSPFFQLPNQNNTISTNTSGGHIIHKAIRAIQPSIFISYNVLSSVGEDDRN